MSFSVTCNFIIVTPGKKCILTFFFQVSLKYFVKKMLPSATVVIRGLCL